MKPIGSVTTISPGAACSETGTPRGAHGSAMPVASTEAASWLARHHPVEVDQAALSRASRLGAELRVRFEGRYPTGPNGERLPSYQVAVGCEVDGTPVALDSAQSALAGFMTPAEAREIEGWLAELSVIVARRPGPEFDECLRLEAYAGRLRRYPADVVRAALLDRSWQFWPTWRELEVVCDALASPRRAMMAALERGNDWREERTPDEAERKRAQAIAAAYLAEREPF